MKVAVSNIAWPIEHDAPVADTLAALGVSGVEIAPTKVWPNLMETSDVQIDAFRQFWGMRGISIVAAQALLFGRSDLTLFDSAETRQRTLDYLRVVIRMCARAGAKALVFGSPKNRRIGGRDRAAVWQEAVDFFGRVGELAIAEGTAVVMEANPTEYGADFVTRAAEALQLVLAVNHPGFRMHLDTACMMLAGDDAASIIPTSAPFLLHFHASEPHLAPVGDGLVDHSYFAAQLAMTGYGGWISIEMRQIDPFDIQQIREAVVRAHAVYRTPDTKKSTVV